MFERLSERITIWAIMNKKIPIEKRYIYEYGLEVLMLNGSILCGCLLYALLEGCLSFYLAFLVFFAPLRIFVGGKHASTSEMCLACSIVFYLFLQEVGKQKWGEAPNWIWILVTLVAVVLLWIVAPVKNRARPYIEGLWKRNQICARSIIFINVMLFWIFYQRMPKIAYYQMILITGVAVTAVWGRLEYVWKKEEEAE